MKGAGMLIVSLRGVNFGFWSLFGYSGQNIITFSHEGIKICICQCFNMVSFRGQKKALTTPRSVSFRGLIQNFRWASQPLSYASPVHNNLKTTVKSSRSHCVAAADTKEHIQSSKQSRFNDMMDRAYIPWNWCVVWQSPSSDTTCPHCLLVDHKLERP